ncbi:hypothetical protein MSG28_004986 [Choristoneura fumiferana]|uniref:Uncharacterized protein n=1 Tax=Choristoneura fumiferana TaxID=7141 RepID=A0ACC0JQ46_CHOFU|nr:hypothetical protein MSG28_004986 [Choristoneura fumiferana]
MFLHSQPLKKLNSICAICRHIVIPKNYSQEVDGKYSDEQKDKIVKVINDIRDDLSGYDISKAKLKKFSEWRNSKGQIKILTDLELVDGFTKKTVIKLCDSILQGPEEKPRKSIKEWKYYPIEYPDGKKLQITDIYDIAEATSLRAAGSDPSNVKAIAVNLQKAQMIAMLVALINSSGDALETSHETEETPKHKVYFLRHTLPFRLYGTLVGNERVSTDQTVEMLLQNPTDSQVRVSEHLKTMFRSQKELQKDMLGHSLLLGLTFMDLCIYKNQESIEKLIKRNET